MSFETFQPAKLPKRVAFAFAVALVALLLSFAGAVRSADAAPAERVSESGCTSFPTGYVACYELDGVTQVTVTPSGNTKFTGSGRFCASAYFNGGSLGESCGSYQFVEFTKYDAPQVIHVVLREKTTVGEIVCTVNLNVSLVNGAVRHAVDSQGCA